LVLPRGPDQVIRVIDLRSSYSQAELEGFSIVIVFQISVW